MSLHHHFRREMDIDTHYLAYRSWGIVPHIGKTLLKFNDLISQIFKLYSFKSKFDQNNFVCREF